MDSRLAVKALGLLLTVFVGAAAGQSIPVPDGLEADGLVGQFGITAPAEEVVSEQHLAEIRQACRCCPEWANYLVFDTLFLQRDNATTDRPIAVGSDVSPNPGVPILTTQSMQFATAPGVRLFYGHRGPDGVGWEVGYLGVYGMFADANVASADQLAVPGDLGQAVPGWATANVERPTYTSSLNIVETNLFLYDCCETCDPCSSYECLRSSRCRCTDLIGGFFWAGLNEQANLNVTCCEGESPTAYTVNTASNMFGAQVGLRRRADWCRWAFERTYKVGLAGTSLYQSGSAITSSLNPGAIYRDPQSDAIGGVGLLSQINLTAVYRINRQWGLRAGYNFIWLAGVALAPDQWDFTDTTTSGSQLVNGGGLFLHGANLGLERRW
jgi:hypothetical protein